MYRMLVWKTGDFVLNVARLTNEQVQQLNKLSDRFNPTNKNRFGICYIGLNLKPFHTPATQLVKTMDEVYQEDDQLLIQCLQPS